MIRVVPKNPSEDALGSAEKQWLEVRAVSVYVNGVAAARVNRPLDQFGEPSDNTDLDATHARHGLMSKLDKIKLDAIDPSAYGPGDMLEATYDPTGAAADAFSMGNMAETSTAKVMTADERTKLAGIDAGAQVNPTASAIKSAYESNADTNAFTDAAQSKLAGIEAGANAYVLPLPTTTVIGGVKRNAGAGGQYVNGIDAAGNLTYKQVEAVELFEGDGLVVMTEAERTKLDGIEAGAQVNPTASVIKSDYESNSNTNAFTDAEKSKLAGLESSRFKGTFVSLSALTTAHPSPGEGSYAHVDAGVGETVQHYIWDADDEEWTIQVGDGGEETAASIKTKYESNADTNAFTDAEKAKMANVPADTNAELSAKETPAGAQARVDSHDTNTAGVHGITDFGSVMNGAYNAPEARGFLGLGDSSTRDIGTSAGTVAAGDDSRLSDSRNPTSHASSHVTGGGDKIRDATASQDGLMTAAYAGKLDNIEAAAQVNPSASAIKSAYESNADTNVFTDAEKSKLSGIEAGAMMIPPGVVVPFAGVSAPTGWLLCAGQVVSRTTYAALFAAIGTTYGAGDGSTTFNLPDLRGRVSAGKDDMGGTPANRLVASHAHGIAGNTLGASGGVGQHLLTANESGLRAHNHSYVYRNIGSNTQNGTASRPVNGTVGGATGDAGPLDAIEEHTNVQPTLVLNYIIRT